MAWWCWNSRAALFLPQQMQRGFEHATAAFTVAESLVLPALFLACCCILTETSGNAHDPRMHTISPYSLCAYRGAIVVPAGRLPCQRYVKT
jgi:hypothetical protein